MSEGSEFTKGMIIGEVGVALVLFIGEWYGVVIGMAFLALATSLHEKFKEIGDE